jgi:hypothetical protein
MPSFSKTRVAGGFSNANSPTVFSVITLIVFHLDVLSVLRVVMARL